MIPAGFKPMLAINADKVTRQPKYQLMSEKLDGVRVVFFGGVAYSRSLKVLPNRLLQKLAKDNAAVLEGCDGEVIAGDPRAKDVLQRSTSFAMKEGSEDIFHVYLFDKYVPETCYSYRYNLIDVDNLPLCMSRLNQYEVKSEAYPHGMELSRFELGVIQSGGEGVMIRDAMSFYKCGRSGKLNPELQKVKRFDDDEFQIVGWTQFETNLNAAETNELGQTHRSTKKEGKVPLEALGSLVCALKSGDTFSVGSGFTEKQRYELWNIRQNLMGKFAKVQFFGYSPDGIPLLPVFLDFRDPIDMD